MQAIQIMYFHYEQPQLLLVIFTNVNVYECKWIRSRIIYEKVAKKLIASRLTITPYFKILATTNQN